MSDLPAPAASLGASPDRDLLDADVVAALGERLRPLAVALYRCVGAPLSPHLLLRASARRGEACLPGDAPWTPLHALPALASHALYRRVAASGQPVVDAPAAADAPAHWRSHVFALHDGSACRGLLELLTDGPLTPAQQALVSGLLARHRDGPVPNADDGAHDRLTGLPNRARFDAEFGACLVDPGTAVPPEAIAPDGQWEARSTALAQARWLGLIDCGRAGAWIDEHALQQLARRLRAALRHGDRLYRIGDADFAVLLRAQAQGQVEQAMARCRNRLGRAAVASSGLIMVRVGCTALGPTDTAQAALARVRAALPAVV